MINGAISYRIHAFPVNKQQHHIIKRENKIIKYNKQIQQEKKNSTCYSSTAKIINQLSYIPVLTHLVFKTMDRNTYTLYLCIILAKD